MIRPLPCLLLLCCLLLPTPGSATALPRHEIVLRFTLADGLVHGSSRITIPAATPLTLRCGPLRLLAVSLEAEGAAAPLTPDDRNQLHLPPAANERVLRLTWELRAKEQHSPDTLVSEAGIALAGFWHPLSDGDMHFALAARVPAGFEAVSEAEEISRNQTGDSSTFTFNFPHPLAGLHFVAGPYRVASRQLDGVTITTYFFAEDEPLAGEYLDRTVASIERYQQLLGPFPYRRYAVVANRLPTGYGMPTFTLLGQTVLRLPFITATSLGHEVLHSWFGNSIRVAATGGNWAEGLTTYLADQAFSRDQGTDTAFRKQQLIRYLSYVHPETAIPLTGFLGAGDGQPLDRALRSVGYDKGSMVFHLLRQQMGETAFADGLRSFARAHRHQSASWADLEAAFTASAGQDLAPFFRQWLERVDLPRIKAEQPVIDHRAGKTLLRFDLVQDSSPPFRLEVPVRIATLGGTVDRSVSVSTGRTPVAIELDSLPIDLTFDPGYDLFRALAPEELPPTWSRFLGAGNRNLLVPDTDQAIYAPLIDLLAQDGATLRPATAVSASDLAQGSWLLAGDSPQRRSLFAAWQGESGGFSLEVRRSPLNEEAVMVLVDSPSLEETLAAAAKLRHYGPSSRLRFSGGLIRDKTTAPTADGIRLPLLHPPGGVATQSLLGFETIISTLAEQRVIYTGETHTDYGNHLLQLQLIQGLHARGLPLLIGMEMFPRASQEALDAYVLEHSTSERQFLKASRYLDVWGYDYRLYRGIIEFARANRIPLIGLNLDKTITAAVFSSGSTDSLNSEQQAAIPAERDLDLPGYRERLAPIHGLHGSESNKGFSGFIQAQALWDETMAESVVKALEAHPQHRIIVLAGDGHVHRESGMPPRVARRLPGIGQAVVMAADGQRLNNAGREADYLLTAPRIDLEPAARLGVVLREAKDATGRTQVLISAISPEGLAGKAGLVPEDRLLAVAGEPVGDSADVRLALIGRKPGERVAVLLERAGEEHHLEVELSALEGGTSMPADHPRK